MRIRRLSNSIGAEVLEFEVSPHLSLDVVSELRDLFLEHQVLLFRDQRISFETHIDFSRHFGELDTHESTPDYRADGYPHLLKVTNEGREREKVFGQQWHSDYSMTLRPAMASLLHAHEIPEVGGDTMFTNMYAAYDTLSDAMKRLLLPLKAEHSVLGARHLRNVDTELRAQRSKLNPPVLHPVVRAHPETGRKALYMNEMHTTNFEGMTVDESQPLLAYLFEHSTRSEFVYRHQWRKHDLLMWDNRCTMHLALQDYDYRQLRRLYRTTLIGELEGAYA
ncbi:TauD/TfdA dioxygenase family protein [Variovorax sp. ZT5P49]|jgi:taurine dioxygenase|uniref:TauD/TfdA dioxygenase family protein n=1 Tax=Variovorax sp. ZT5P49 TaxID=3443733 RepID=UPI003F453292